RDQDGIRSRSPCRYCRLKGGSHALNPVLHHREESELARRIDVGEIVLDMKACTPCVEYAYAIERRNAELVFPRNRLSSSSNGDREARAWRRFRVRPYIVENVLGCPQAGGAF